MADVAELHQEARELPVRQNNELISQQFALACHLPQKSCHQLCLRSPDDRSDRRRSLIGRFWPNIQQYLAEEPINNTSYKSAISSINQDAVWTAIESSSWKLLNVRTNTTKEDKNYTGTTAYRSQLYPWSVHEHNRSDSAQPLARLWSLWSLWSVARLWSFASWHPSPFLYPSKPTTLTVESLLTAPNETAKHLNLAIDETSQQQQQQKTVCIIQSTFPQKILCYSLLHICWYCISLYITEQTWIFHVCGQSHSWTINSWKQRLDVWWIHQNG